MKKTRSANDFEIVHEPIPMDDGELLHMFQKLNGMIKEKEDSFLRTRSSFDENNYLRFCMARLAYFFVKEEYEAVSLEVQKRGLMI